MSGGFDALGLMDELLQSIYELGWNLPTDIQDEAIPLILGGGDVMAAAETGSGKTAAFCLPIIQCVHERLRGFSDGSTSGRIVGNTPNKAAKTQFDVRLSLTDKDIKLDVDEDGLSCESPTHGIWAGARATHGVNSGRYYFECIVSAQGICRLGWSTISAHLELGKDVHGFGYGGTGKKSNGGAFADYGDGAFRTGDAIGCYIDLHDMTISYSKNGKYLGKAFEIPADYRGAVFFPAVLLKNSELVANFGQHAFKHPPMVKGYMSMFEGKTGQVFRADANEVFNTCIGGGGGDGSSSSRNKHGKNSSNNNNNNNNNNNTTTTDGGAGGGRRRPMALIIEPTRDLAEQVHTAIRDFTAHVSAPQVRHALAIGGEEGGGGGTGGGSGGGRVRIEKQLQQEGGVDIVVGTLGKLTGLVKSKVLDLSQIRFFVLDEADRLLQDESIAEVMHLFNCCPGGGAGQNRLQVCFFSATLRSPPIVQLSQKICVNPSWVDLKGDTAPPETVHHVMYRVLLPVSDTAAAPAPAAGGGNGSGCGYDQQILREAHIAAITDGVHLPDELHSKSTGSNDNSKRSNEMSQKVKEIKQHILIKLIDKYEMSQCLVFCRTNVDCTNLESFLAQHNGGKKSFSEKKETGKEGRYSCCVLAGMRSMEERRRNLQALKEGDVRILICTDVASRGIDVEGLPFVINMTLPDEPENYIHRIGRVGRADRMGLAISLVSADHIQEKVWYHTCANRGRNCANRKLVEQGGCTIWYDESQCLSKIEALMKRKIAVMGNTTINTTGSNDKSGKKNKNSKSNNTNSKKEQQPAVGFGQQKFDPLALPEEIASLNIRYGEDTLKEEVVENVHIAQLAPSVQELGKMELSAQNLFLNFQSRNW